LIALLLIWTMSLVGSNVSRYFLYSQMGDWSHSIYLVQ
jgi:hypothetical protein